MDAACRWFLESGIQDQDGGVARYYRADVQNNRPVSTEITAYAVSALAFIYKVTGDPSALSAAKKAGTFLAGFAWDRSLEIFPHEHFPPNDERPRLAYFFDSGIIVRGLLKLWKVTCHPAFLSMAVDCGRGILRDFRAASGFHPVLALPSKEPLDDDSRWSRSIGCYQLKSAMALHELFLETEDPAFEFAYETALEDALNNYETFLAEEPDRERLMDRLHAYCYFLEGLLPRMARQDCRRALAQGIDQVGGLVEELANRFDRSDVYAQLLRLRLYAARIGVRSLDKYTATEEAARIASFQLRSADPRIHGGFAFGRRAGELIPHVNPVSTAFGIQALEMWRLYCHDDFDPKPSDLI